MSQNPTIVYTQTDEAPALATYSLLPILRAFIGSAGVDMELRDISLAGRILAVFPDHLTAEQQIPDALAELGELAKRPEANIIKLPNISASVPQLKACIAELQTLGFDLPNYPEEAKTDAERALKARYDKVKGSAVNPVLREGNSDRRAPPAVKAYARQNPHRMGAWTADSGSHVATMSKGDFFHNEPPRPSPPRPPRASNTSVRMESTGCSKTASRCKTGKSSSSLMERAQLIAFLEEQVQDAKDKGVLFSLHMKATMMKVSDPIIFGHAVRVFFADLFATHGTALDAVAPT